VNIFDLELDKKDSERRIHPVQQTSVAGIGTERIKPRK
jgi:hypothetical protein